MADGARTRRLLVAWLAGALFYAWCVAPRMGLPYLGDEAFFAARVTEATHDVIPHPPAYIGLLQFGVAHLHWTEAQYRWIGVTSFLASLGLLGLLTERLIAGTGLWAMGLWALHPMAVQGSLILDIDNTILTSAVLAFLLVLLWAPWPLSRRRRWVLTGLWTLGLWMKLAAVAPMGLALGIAWLVGDQRQRAWRDVIAIVGWGTAGFVVLWGGYAHAQHLDPWLIVRHSLKSLQPEYAMPAIGDNREWVMRAVRMLLWWLPWSVPATVVAIGWWRRLPPGLLRWRVTVLAVTVLGVVGSYCVVRGLHYSFPKYQYPALPLALVWWVGAAHAAGISGTRPQHWRWGLAAALVMAVVTWGIGDLPYLVNATLRRALVEAPETVRVIATHLGWCLTAWVLSGAVLWGVLRWRRSRALSLGMLSLWLLAGASIAYDVRQRRAPYATTFCYGRSYDDFARVTARLARLRQAQPQARVFAPIDVAHAAGYTEHDWRRMLSDVVATRPAYLADPRLAAVIISWGYHSLAQLREFHAAPAQTVLTQQFHREALGEYTWWARRAEPRP